MKTTWRKFFLVNIVLALSVLVFLVACEDPSGGSSDSSGSVSCVKSYSGYSYCFELSDSSDCEDQGGAVISGTCADAGYTTTCPGLPSYSYFKVCP